MCWSKCGKKEKLPGRFGKNMEIESRYLPSIKVSPSGLVAIKAALSAGVAIRRFIGGWLVEKEGISNVQTEADQASGQEIRRVLAESQDLAKFHILSEEGDEIINDPLSVDRLWIVDELDGSKNFADRIDNVWISIAYAEAGDVKVGVCYNPILDKMFFAEAGKGAYYLGREYGSDRWVNKRIEVSRQNDLSKSTIETSISYDVDENIDHQVIRLALPLLGETVRYREIGSSVEQLCRVAAGISDLHFHTGLKPWDYAASLLIVKEAGGVFRRMDGSEFNFMSPDCVVGNKELVEKFVDFVSKIKGNKKLKGLIEQRIDELKLGDKK